MDARGLHAGKKLVPISDNVEESTSAEVGHVFAWRWPTCHGKKEGEAYFSRENGFPLLKWLLRRGAAVAPGCAEGRESSPQKNLYKLGPTKCLSGGHYRSKPYRLYCPITFYRTLVSFCGSLSSCIWAIRSTSKNNSTHDSCQYFYLLPCNSYKTSIAYRVRGMMHGLSFTLII